MTKNERIAFALLEAIDVIMREDFNSKQNADDYDVLLNTIIEPEELLNESITDLDNVKMPDASDNKNVFLKKLNTIKTTVSSLARWYYKIEPVKRFQTLHNFLRILNNTVVKLLFVLSKIANKTSCIKAIKGGRLNDNGYKQIMIITLLYFLTDTIRDVIETPIIIKYNVDEYYETINEWAETTKQLDNEIRNCKDPKVKQDLIELRDRYLVAYDRLNSTYHRYKNSI